MKITITEALQEIKTIKSRIAKKIDFINRNAYRNAQHIDPFADQGGSLKVVYDHIQSVIDMSNRLVKIRSAIAESNLKTELTLGYFTKSVADWIIWQREVAPFEDSIYSKLASISSVRNTYTDKASDAKGFIMHFDDKFILDKADNLAKLKGDLDGKLSLLNATTLIEIPD